MSPTINYQLIYFIPLKQHDGIIMTRAHTPSCTNVIIQKQTFVRIYTHFYLSEHLYCNTVLYIEYAFDKCREQLTINQLIFAILIAPVASASGIRLMLAPPNSFDVAHYYNTQLSYHLSLGRAISSVGRAVCAELLPGPNCLGFDRLNRFKPYHNVPFPDSEIMMSTNMITPRKQICGLISQVVKEQNDWLVN